ncbi:MAG: protein kinase, partial [Planctomycetota bacterium]
EDGIPTVLDFGLSWSEEVTTRLTSAGRIVGTPRYLSPEQIRGEGIDGRVDLYALGVMLYEALTGRTLFPGRTLEEVFTAKLAGAGSALQRLEGVAPRRVIELVESLLATNPDDRPRSMIEVIAELAEGEETAEFPWLGPVAPLDRVRAAVESRSLLDVVGPPGSGRTRCLRAAEAHAESSGRRVWWVRPDPRPFASFEGADLKPAPRSGTLDSMIEFWTATVVESIASGDQWLVDDHDALDPHTQRVVEAVRPNGSVIRALADSDGIRDAIELTPLTPIDLLELFHGPDRFFHFREDGAKQLHARTLGIPRLVRDEVRAWVRSGIAKKDESKLRLDRASLDRLAAGMETSPGVVRGTFGRRPPTDRHDELLAWIQFVAPHATISVLANLSDRPEWEVEATLRELQSLHLVRLSQNHWLPLAASAMSSQWSMAQRQDAHRRAASVLPAESEGRLHHLMESFIEEVEDPDLLRETIAVVERQRQEGRIGTAISVADRASLSFPQDSDGEVRLLELWVGLVFSSGDLAAAERLKNRIGDRERTRHVRNLIDVFVAIFRGQHESARGRLVALPTLKNGRLDHWRHALRYMAARDIDDPEQEQRVLEEVERELGSSMDQGLERSLRSWKARTMYGRGQFSDSAEAYEAISHSDATGAPRLAALLGAAEACLEIPDLPRAREHAEDGRQLASEIRHAIHEVRATHMVRTADYREGRELSSDDEILRAGESLNLPIVHAPITLLEAAIAWRNEDLDRARSIAVNSVSAWEVLRRPWPAGLARLLANLCGEPVDPSLSKKDLELARSCPWPGLRFQIEALSHMASVKADTIRYDLDQLLEFAPRERWSNRREVLSLSECAQILEATK